MNSNNDSTMDALKIELEHKNKIPANKPIKRLVQYFAPYKFWFLLILVFSALSVTFTIIAPFFLGKVTDIMLKGASAIMAGTGNMNYESIAKILLLLAVIYIFSSIFNLLQQQVTSRISQKTIYDLRQSVNLKIAKLPLNYFDTHTYGEVLSKTTSDIERISATLQTALTQLVTSFFTIIGILVMMLWLSLPMTIIALLILPLAMFFTKAVIKHSQKYFVSQQQSLSDMNSYVEEMYSGHNIITLFNKQKDTLKDFETINNKLNKDGAKAQFFSSMLMPLIQFAGSLGYVMVCIVGGLLTSGAMLTVGVIQSFIQYVQQFTQPLVQTANIANVFQQTMAAAERVFELLDEAEQVQERENLTTMHQTKGKVSFEHVCFGYSPDKILINDMNVEVEPGQKVAIVGPTGAGKTTLVNLLMRFYELTGGKIKIDGIDIQDISREDLREMIGMVLQETWLYSGSVADNIGYAEKDMPRDQVIAAAKTANVDFFVSTWPGGYDMHLEEDAGNLSQGQKQLLTIARAFASNPYILILDEATSSVDTRTERLIQEAMQKLTVGKTSFVIAHRLSTIKDSDLILYMENGDIKEQGNHDTLLAKNGKYAALYNSQFA